MFLDGLERTSNAELVRSGRGGGVELKQKGKRITRAARGEAGRGSALGDSRMGSETECFDRPLFQTGCIGFPRRVPSSCLCRKRGERGTRYRLPLALSADLSASLGNACRKTEVVIAAAMQKAPREKKGGERTDSGSGWGSKGEIQSTVAGRESVPLCNWR